MKEYLKREWPFLLLFIILIGLTLMYFSLLNNGFCTAWDESYFLLKLQEAYDNSCITGKSQWNFLAIHWFPYLNLVNPIHSRIAIWICIFSATVVAVLSLWLIYGRQHLLRYFTISYLLFFMIPTTYAGESLNYVPMQSLLLCSALCLFLVSIKMNNQWFAGLFSISVGISLGLAIFVILPSSCLLVFCFAILYLIEKHFSKILGMLLGIVLSIIYIHCFVCPIPELIDAMQFTATYITKSGYGYTPTKFIISILLFFKDWAIICFGLLGIFYVSAKFQNKWLQICVFVLAILIFLNYQKEPRITISEFIALLFIIPTIEYIVKGKVCILNYRDYIFNTFLFFFPLIAAIGTNTYLGSRMLCFTVSWLFLLIHLMQTNVISYKHRLTFVVFICCICLLLNNIAPSYINRLSHRNKMEHFVKGNKYFAQMEITKDQKEYFTLVDSLMCTYNYVPNKSVIFTSEYDYATVYAFDAKLSSNFYQKNNFLYAPIDKLIEPDFIFLCQWDIDVIGEHLKSMPWGWPDDYDKFYVGSPEGISFPWDANRWLYCKKNLK